MKNHPRIFIFALLLFQTSVNDLVFEGGASKYKSPKLREYALSCSY